MVFNLTRAVRILADDLGDGAVAMFSLAARLSARSIGRSVLEMARRLVTSRLGCSGAVTVSLGQVICRRPRMP